ncbi:hypothetical protein JYU34_007537 [Plutella xylostella]|uniref:Uncharacterized protein n=1 Tax=Plutella xylostella TaxID=51655 RepID=A0ABQ7QQP0_PLUXY|nr:hypothetical protein JYU34_007537 [Plutella xylostella]
MATAQDILNKQIGIEKVLGTWIEDYERRLKASSTPENKSNLESLTKDFEAFKKSVLDIFRLLQDQIVGLMQQVDELDCQSRRKVLLFSGIAEDANESLPAVISNIAVAKMGITDFQESAMQQCIRLGAPNSKRPRPVLVRLASLSIKAAIWSNKKRLKTSSVVVSEFLTRTRQELYSRSSESFSELLFSDSTVRRNHCSSTVCSSKKSFSDSTVRRKHCSTMVALPKKSFAD